MKVVHQAWNEYKTTGKLTDFFQAVLDHYEGLAVIEQAPYPADYAADSADRIKRDFNSVTHPAEGNHRKDFKSLIERWLGENLNGSIQHI